MDLRDATVIADLSTADGRANAVSQVTELAGGDDGVIDGLVTWAGLAGLTDRPGSLLAAVNYFGTVAVLEGLRPLLARGEQPAAVAISSNSTLVQPGVPLDVVEACLSGDEEVALARRMIAAYAEARARGEGVAEVDGKIVENLHVATAEALIGKAEAIAAHSFAPASV